MVEIIPAIMPKDFAELREYLEAVRGAAPIVQIDVMDGVFVPNTSWPYSGEYARFESIAGERDEMPWWSEVDFEADLMVARPDNEVEKWLNAGARRVVVHIGGFGAATGAATQMETGRLARVLSVANDYRRREQESDEFYAPTEIGLALTVDTPNEALAPWVRDVDFIQCMGIAEVGFQGQEFDERVLEKVKDLREKLPDGIISIDGGVNIETAPRLVEAGANRLVAGSAIWGHPSGDVEEAIEELRAAARSDG